MGERLALQLERDGAVVVLRLVGELNQATAPLLAGTLKALLDGRASLKLDLEGIHSIDGAGLDLLFAAEADAVLAGAAFEVVGLQESLRHAQSTRSPPAQTGSA